MPVFYGVALATILTITALIIIFSYQEYATNIIRKEGNYEAEFKNIEYSKVKEIKKDENIKEVSVSYEIGTSVENLHKPTNENNYVSKRINIIAYDENSIKNNNIVLTEGRLPQNSSEIVVSTNMLLDLTTFQEIELTINGEKNKYTIVGLTKDLPNDHADFSFQFIVGAFTYYDETVLNDESLVNVSVLSKNIHKIVDTSNALSDRLSLYKTDEEKENNLIFNEYLLRYSLVDFPEKENNGIIGVEEYTSKEFKINLKKIVISMMAIIGIASVIVIFTSFKMTFSERVKELGMLTSIGMSKRQKINMLIKETIIIATIGIIIGLILGTILSLFMTRILDILSSNLGIHEGVFLTNPNVDFYMVIPVKIVLVTIIFIYLITIISSFSPIIKSSKISPIEAMKRLENNKNKRKTKVPKIIYKLFKQEGVLAYKNIKYDKMRYRTVIISIAISIILFLSINEILSIYLNANGENGNINKKETIYTSSTTINYEKSKDILIEKLQEKNLLNKYLAVRTLMTDSTSGIKIVVPKEKLTEKANTLIPIIGSQEISDKYEVLPTTVMVVSGQEYDEILKNLGIDKLGIDECILNDVYTGDTKYGKNIKMSNFSVGDEIVIKEINNSSALSSYTNQNAKVDEESLKQEQEILSNILGGFGSTTNNSQKDTEIKEKDHNLKIVGMVDNISEDSILNKPLHNFCYIFISEETAKKWGVSSGLGEEYKVGELMFASNNIYLYTNSPEEVDITIAEINEDAKDQGLNIVISRDTSYKSDRQNAYLGVLKKFVVYTFIIFIVLMCSINIFTAISSNIYLRKKEFAELKSLGMSKKSLSKMLYWEALFYAIDAIFYGLAISILILYLIYNFIVDSEYNFTPFTLPYINFAICIITAYFIIFGSMIHARKKVKNRNIVDEIRNENI